jgi:hypothetical protein
MHAEGGGNTKLYYAIYENDIDSACSLSLPGAQDLESMLIY